MTTYRPEDMDWEFKIVRANLPVFRSSRHLERLLEEEGQAGWTLLEKFDNSRIRLKRPRQARINDAKLPYGVDPYRVHYGMSPVAFTLLTVIGVLALTGLIVAGTFLAVSAFVPVR